MVPEIFDILAGQAIDITRTPFGRVGDLYRGQGIRAVWVEKNNEDIDPDWFSQDTIDLLLVVQGALKADFERSDLASRVVKAGSLLVLPPKTRCRAYRWPREQPEATIFVAVYPDLAASSAQRPTDPQNENDDA